MSTIEIVLFVAAQLIGIYGIVCFVGMHNNTIDGNTFKLLVPFVTWDSRHFNERGNYWRVRYNRAWILAAIVGTLFYAIHLT